jgi:antitoxin (DNA-binding transcriptional repressor) of toxin-antitoxin stability system
MKAIGIRELKAGLSRYLRDVAAGEVVLVTDRGRVVAELRAPGDTPVHETDFERRLRIMATQYPLTIGRRRKDYHYELEPIDHPVPPGTVKALLDAERDDSDRLR